MEHEPYDLSVSDAAEILGLHPQTVRQYADAGRLPCRRLPGGHRRFRRADLDALLAPDKEAAK